MSKKSTKGALLASGISLLLCFTMLLGTTFAWFTDSVSTTNNIITAGNLDVELYYQNDTTSGWTTVDANTNIFKTGTLWEPGHAEVIQLKVANEGTLALKYQLGVNIASEIGSVNAAGQTFKLSDYIKYAVVDGEHTYTSSADAAAAAETAGAKKLNVAHDSGVIDLSADASSAVTVIVYMPTTVGNEANYGKGQVQPTINLGINLFATQMQAEADSFGTDYDALAGIPWDGSEKADPQVDANGVIHVTNAAELVAMMDVTGNSIYSGKTIVLDADINLNGHTVKGIGSDGTNFAGIFDGQGHTISNFKIDASNRSYYAGLFNQVSHGGTVKNLTVRGATVIGTSMVGAVASSVDSNAAVTNCKAIDCTLIGVKKVGAVIGYTLGSEVTNNYAENCRVYYSEKEGAEILGYENSGSTVSGNSFSNVIVSNSTVATSAAALKAAASKGGNILLGADIKDLNANTAITVAAGKDVVLDLNGHKISAVANSTGNQELFLVKGNMTVKNGTMEFTAENNQGWNAMATLFDVTAGGVLNMEKVKASVSGTDMNFIVHLNNWGTATLNVDDCDFTTTYVAVRAFNSGYDMNNITIKNTDFHGGRVFWVHNYTAEGKDDSTLNLSIYGNSNTTDNEKPIRYGFSNSSYYDINGNLL